MKLTFLITAGPTREYIDPVRYISNASSGKMGYALAESAVRKGHRVILISGPTDLPKPGRVELVPVVSAEQMFKKTLKYFNAADVVIGSAAVADYKPSHEAKQKLKKKPGKLSLSLAATKDILKYLGKIKKKQILAGFALESKNLFAEAKKKLKRKNLDLIVANYPDSIGSEKSSAWILDDMGGISAHKGMTKKRIAERIINETIKLAAARKAR